MRGGIALQTLFCILLLFCLTAKGWPESPAGNFSPQSGKVIQQALRGPDAGIDTPQIAEIPRRHVIGDVPLYLQGNAECGPMSLSMVMHYYGLRISAAALKTGLHWRIDDGVSQQSMVLFPFRDYGLEMVYSGGGDLQRLLLEIAHGCPVIVRQWATPQDKREGHIGHWRVVVGYDQESRKIYLNDPIFRLIGLDYGEFLELWDMESHANPTRNFMLCLRNRPQSTFHRLSDVPN